MNRKKRFLAIILTLSIVAGSVSVTNLKVLAASVKQNINITQIYNTKTGVKLKWTNSYSATGYEIYRSKNGENFSKCDVTKSKKYTDVDAETGESYKYKVKAYKYKKDKKKYSSFSKESIEIVAGSNSVTNVKVKLYADQSVLTWTVNPQASGYDVYRNENGGKWYLIDSTTNSGTYTDINLDESITYSYKVMSFEIVDGLKYYSVMSSEANNNNQKGIDISYHNGTINWSKVKKAGITFAMIRLGYGTKKSGVVDSKLDYNYREAKKNGIKVGLYLYSYADNKTEAKNEAKFTARMLKKYDDLDFPIAFDFENTNRNKKKYKSANTKIIQTYCDYLEKRGYDTSVYSFLNFFQRAVECKKISKYGIWLARWSKNPNAFNDGGISNVQMWQYSSSGKVNGIGSRVDLNIGIGK